MGIKRGWSVSFNTFPNFKRRVKYFLLLVILLLFVILALAAAPNTPTINAPGNGTSTSNTWNLLNFSVTDPEADAMTVYIYASNDSNGLINNSKNLVYLQENVASGSNITYNLTTLPIDPAGAYSNSLVALWHFDNRSEFGENDSLNGNVYDFSGNGNNGTLGNTTSGTNPIWNSTGGKFAGAYEFDGINDSLLVPDDDSLDFDKNENFSISLWVKIEGNSAQDRAFSKSSYYLKFVNYIPTFFVYNNTAGSGNLNIGTGSSITLSEWHHLVLSFERESATGGKLYLDGILNNSGSTVNIGDLSNTWNFTIGSHVDFTRNFNGSIDDLALWNRSLSAAEVLDIYRLGSDKYYWQVNVSDGSASTLSNLSEFSVDATFPTWENNKTNLTTSTALGESVYFNITLNEANPDSYIFSWYNGTDWENNTATSYTDGEEVEITKTININSGTINWTWYINDTLNNLNQTPVWGMILNTTISLTYPLQYSIWQRHNDSTGTIPIYGTYTGADPSAIEASFNGGVYTNISVSPSGNSFSGELNASVGNGTLIVRFSNNPSINSSLNNTGVGDVFVIAGQSNAVGRGEIAQILNSSNQFMASAFMQNSTWKLANDPIESSGTKNSAWPLVANYIVQNQSIPIAFLQTAVGATSIISWQKGQSKYDEMIGNMTVATNGSMKVKTMLWFQGYSDVTECCSTYGNYLHYKSNLTRLADDFINDTQIAITIIAGQTNRAGDVSLVDNIRRAQQDAWYEVNNVSRGPVTYDITMSDAATHFWTNKENQAYAKRWWAAIGEQIYNISSLAYPKLINITLWTNSTTSNLTLTFNVTTPSLVIEDFNGTAGATFIEGWKIKDGSIVYNDTNITSTTINNNKIVLNLPYNLSSSVNVTYGSRWEAYGKNVSRDNSTLKLPIELLFEATINDTAPAITLTAPADNSGDNDGNVTFVYNAIDNEESIDNCSLIVNYKINLTNSTIIESTIQNFTLNDLPVGSYNWSVNCTDSSNNIGASETREFTVDTSAPTIDYTGGTLTNATWYSQNWVYVNISASDTNLDTVTFEWNGTNETFDDNYYENKTSLADGNYTFRAYVNDSAGNENKTGLRIVYLDTTNPVITLISLTNNSGDSDGNITFNYNVTDTNNVTNCSLIVNNEINITNSSITKSATQTFAINNLAIASYNWSVNCTDQVNNINNSETRILTVITTTDFGGDTTDLSTVNISNITNFIIEQTSYGKINFSAIVDLSGGADINSYVNISNNRIEINSTALPALNKAARLILYNLTFTNPRVLRDGSVCSSSICTEVSYLKSGGYGNFTFNITQFSVYSSEETPSTTTTTTTSSSTTSGGSIGSSRLGEKITLYFKKGITYPIYIGNENHIITITDIKETSATLFFNSSGIVMNLILDITGYLNHDNDDYNDLKIKLVNVYGDLVKVEITPIHDLITENVDKTEEPAEEIEEEPFPEEPVEKPSAESPPTTLPHSTKEKIPIAWLIFLSVVATGLIIYFMFAKKTIKKG